ncbi:MAG: hypothetical protein Q8R66_03855 [Methanobacteriaceae archaeon]|nr:hypothetical protein [Methanobacteriaceae archaeon]
MTEKKIFIKLGSSLGLIFLSILLWIFFESPASLIFVLWGLLFAVNSIYEYKTQKESKFLMWGIFFIVLFSIVLTWVLYINHP